MKIYSDSIDFRVERPFNSEEIVRWIPYTDILVFLDHVDYFTQREQSGSIRNLRLDKETITTTNSFGIAKIVGSWEQKMVSYSTEVADLAELKTLLRLYDGYDVELGGDGEFWLEIH